MERRFATFFFGNPASRVAGRSLRISPARTASCGEPPAATASRVAGSVAALALGPVGVSANPVPPSDRSARGAPGGVRPTFGIRWQKTAWPRRYAPQQIVSELIGTGTGSVGTAVNYGVAASPWETVAADVNLNGRNMRQVCFRRGIYNAALTWVTCLQERSAL